jgi:hypothetical protein
MPLSVIGAGFGRTGTLSLKAALERLGFDPCHHMLEVAAHPDQVPYWERALDGEAIEWDDVLGRYRASVDWPSCHFYAELAARYPDAKVVLTERDPDRWYRSACDTIFAVMDRGGPPGPAGAVLRMATRVVRDIAFGGSTKDAAAVKARMLRHNADVKRTIPADRLLVYQVSEGWEPLCRFLDVPVPDAPFPHVNTTDDFRKMFERGGARA